MLIIDYLSPNIIIWIIFLIWPILEVGQKYGNVFVRFLVQMKTSKSNSEINWPLATNWAMRVVFKGATAGWQMLAKSE